MFPTKSIFGSCQAEILILGINEINKKEYHNKHTIKNIAKIALKNLLLCDDKDVPCLVKTATGTGKLT